MEIGNMFVRLGLKSGDYTRGMQEASRQTSMLNKGVKALGATLVGYVGFRVISGQIRDFITASGRQEKAVAGVEQAMRSMGRYSPQLRESLINVAKGLQDVTTYGDEAILEGQKFLLTYKAIGADTLPRASEAMADLAALMGGNTVQAANMLGKASMGLTGELRRVGITVERSTFESEGFLGVLREIESQVKGQARAMAQTGYGGVEQMGNLVGDVKEKIGDLILLKFEDTIKSWNEGLKEVNKVLEEIVEDRKLDKHLEAAAREAAGLNEELKPPGGLVGLLKDINDLLGARGEILEKQAAGGMYGGGGYEKYFAKEKIKAVLAEAKRIADEMIAEDQRVLASKEEVGNKIKELSKEQLKLQAEMTDDINKLTMSETEYAVKKIHEREQELRDAGLEEVEIREWVYENIMELYDKQDKKQKKMTTDFVGGMKKGLEDIQHNMMTWADVGEQIIKDFASNASSTLSDAFFDFFEGELKSFKDYWDRFWKSMLRTFSDILARMVTEWALTQAGMRLQGISLFGAAPAAGATGGVGGAAGAAGAGAAAASWGASFMPMLTVTAAIGFAGQAISNLMGREEKDIGDVVKGNIDQIKKDMKWITEQGAEYKQTEEFAIWKARTLAELDALIASLPTEARCQQMIEADIFGLSYLAKERLKDVRQAKALYEDVQAFRQGIAFIPYTMPAIVHQGERILSSEQNEALIDAINRIGGGSQPIVNVITLDGRIIYQDLYDAGRQGRVRLHDRSIKDLTMAGIDR